MLNNYRVTFGGEDIDYKDNFADCRQYFPVLEELYDLMARYCIEDCWHFFEPYVEFTWVCPADDIQGEDSLGEELLMHIENILEKHGITPNLTHRPQDGVVVDWYCKSPKEQEFGYKTYALSAKMAMLFWKHREEIAQGCGKRNQFMRRPHVLANQLGLNYKEEGKALAQRARLCELFWEEGDHAKAVARYEKEFEEEYL